MPISIRFDLLFFCYILLLCGQVSAKPVRGSWTGTLVDRTCYLHAAKKHDLKLLDGHERSCVMKCAKDGKSLGLLANDKYFGFDPGGEKLAWKLLTKSIQEETLRVTVLGSLSDSVIAVSSIKLSN